MFYVHLTIERFAHVGIYSAVLEKITFYITNNIWKRNWIISPQP